DIVIREIMECLEETESLVLDFKRVLDMNESSCHLLYRLLMKFGDTGSSLLFTHAGHLPLFKRFMKTKLGDHYDALFRLFEDNDPALEWAENRLLESVLPEASPDSSVEPSQYELLDGLTPEELAIVSKLLERRIYLPGEPIINMGEEAAHL